MAIGAGVATVGLGVFSAVQADKRAQEQEDNISNFEREIRDNPAESIRLSTVGTDRLLDSSASSLATSVSALQQAGPRAIIAGMPQLLESDILTRNLITQDLSEQDARRSIAISAEQSRRNRSNELLETQALLGFGQELQNSRQARQDGINNIIGGVLSSSRGIDFGGLTPQVSSPFEGGDPNIEQDIIFNQPLIEGELFPSN